MPRLFLHIGTHKTGTTSIQRFCSANRAALRERRLWYPPSDLGNFPGHYAHHHVAHAIAGRHPTATVDDAVDFFDRVRSKMRPDEAVLISAEPMYRHELAHPDDESIPKGERAELREVRLARYAAAVRQSIGEFDTTVVVMLRRQDLFLESLYAEQILATAYTRPVDRFAAERDHLLDYERRIGVWADVFGHDAVSLATFERSSQTRPIERSFVEFLGVAWDDGLVVGQPHNVTPPRSLVEFKRALNVQGQVKEVDDALRHWIEQLAGELAGDAPDLGKFYLRPKQRVALLERHAAGNRRLARSHLGRDELFTDSVVDELSRFEELRGLNAKEFRMLTKRLVNLIARRVTSAP